MASKIKGLQMWCKKMTEGYPNVDITNFTTAWRNGLAFCALIHRFRPDLIDFDSLSPDNVFENCKMAFELAEKELKIPAFLEASDMARLKVPDKLSIITYVSQYYNYLHALPQLGGPGVIAKVSNKNSSGTKRPPEVDVSQAPISKKATTDLAKENSAPVGVEKVSSLINRCSICQQQVYLLERHMEGGKLYHRSCFRHSELSPTNKVYSRSPFLSPSLNSETPASHFPALNETSDSHGDGLHKDKHQQVTGYSSSNATVDKFNNVKKPEASALKHSLNVPDREDSKKTKYQSSDSSSTKTAIKERLEGLKSKYTEKDKSNDHHLPLSKHTEKDKSHDHHLELSKYSEKEKSPDHNLPLSSKEANKLEKRKAEIISSEKSAETVTKGSLRRMPLIFQKKEEPKSSAGSAQTVSSSSVNLFPESSILKSGFKPAVDTNNQILTEKSKFEDHGIDSKFHQKNTLGNVSTANQEGTQKLSNPTDKPRTLASTFVHELSPAKPFSATSKKSKETTPKPAPRRLFAESSEKKSAPERPKALAISQDSTKPKSKDETPGSLSPPPLPSTLPPSASNHPSSLQSLVSPTETFPVVHITGTHSKISPSAKTASTESKVSKESSRVSEKRWSTPAAVTSTAVLVIPVEKKEEENVRTGLLSSLAMVRNRTMSTPGPTTQNLTLPTQTQAISNQSVNKSTNGTSSKPDHASSNLSATNKSKINTQSKKQIESSVKPFSHNDSSIFKVPDGAPKKDTCTAATKSNNIPESVSALSSLKHVDSPSPLQPQSQTKVTTTNEKSKTPSLMGILKNGIKKSSDAKTKDVSAHEDHSRSPAKNDVSQFSSISIDVKLNERKLADHSDHKKSNIHLIGTDTKSHTDDQKNASKVLTEAKSVKKVSDIPSVGRHVDSTPVRPQRSNSDTLDSDVFNTIEDNSHKPPSTSIADDVPQWKKNIEERKKKREELAKAELSTVRTKYTSSTNDAKARPKSADIIDLLKGNELFKVQPSDISASPRRKSVDNLDKNKENDFDQVLEAKAKLSKPKPKSSEPVTSGSKLDWQVAAEKKMAAIAALDKQLTLQDIGTSIKIDSHMSKLSSVDTRLNGNEDNVKITRGTTQTNLKEPEFVTGKSRLKSIDGNGNNPASKMDVASSVVEKKPEETVPREDFREKLRQLKHVDSDKSEADSDTANVKEMKKDTPMSVTATTLKSEITQPVNNNNNNLTNNTNITDKVHIIRLNDKTCTTSVSSNLREVQNNGKVEDVKLNSSNCEIHMNIDINSSTLVTNHENKLKTNTSEFDSKTTKSGTLQDKTSPKVKRKITVLGRNKQGTLDSPPETPHLKKIEVASKFDFNESLKSSLTESTSKMTISDMRTPPPRPPPMIGKKSPGHISVIELQQQLQDIDSRLTELEIRGRDLEDSIRKVSTNDDNDEDELMIEWFSLVTEKNELVRKEADLVYISREQELENEQEKIESQLRYLLSKQEHLKSPEEKVEEDYLIQRKVELVEQRNVIVDCIDEDRLRYEEEDRQIKTVLEGKGLLKDETGMTRALKGKKVARSIFYT